MPRRKRSTPSAGAKIPRPSAVEASPNSAITLALAAVAAALPIAIYVHALGHPFVYDDFRMIVENPSIRDPANWRWILIYEPFRPLVNLSYALDYWRGGLEPSVFHATNLALHTACTVLFFFVVRGVLRDTRKEKLPASAIPPFAAAALFAVHPIQIEVAGYAAGRSESLCGVFVLSAWLLWRRWATTGATWAGVAGLGCWLLAAASKEVAAALPIVFALYDSWIIGGENAKRRLWRAHVPLLALIAVAAIVRLTSYVQVEVDLPRPLWQNVATQWIVIWRYLGLLAWPKGQTLIHSVEPVGSPFAPVALLAGAALAGLVVLAVRMRRRAPVVSIGILWFLVFLAPSSSLIPLHELMAEHRVYLASCGLWLIIAALLNQIERRRPPEWAWAAARIGVALVVSALALVTVDRLAIWSDPLILWRDAAANSPNEWRARAGYGGALRLAGRCDEAVPVLEEVVRSHRADLNAWMDLGICRAQLGDHPGARASFLEALAIDANFERGHNNLGSLALLQGDVTQATQRFERALELNPRSVTALQNLVQIERRSGADPPRVERLCRELQALSPEAAASVGCGRP